MASTPASEWVLLLLLVLLFPVHLFLLAACRLLSDSTTAAVTTSRRFKKIRWMLPLVSIPLLVSAIFALSDHESPKDDVHLSELKDLKLNLLRLELILEDNTKTWNSKILQLEKGNKLIEEMENRIQFLQSSLSMIKTSLGSSLPSAEMIKSMEEEVQLLWAESRKNNFNIHMLESKVYEEEQKLETVASGVEKIENIVTEQWIQIQQLEQAFQMTKIMTSKVHKKSTSKVHKEKLTTCVLFKFFKGARHRYLPKVADLPDAFFLGNHISKSSISRAFDQLKWITSAAKKWHHELQGSVKWALEANEFTAPLANEEVIFFLASAVIIFPTMIAWRLL